MTPSPLIFACLLKDSAEIQDLKYDILQYSGAGTYNTIGTILPVEVIVISGRRAA